MKKLFQSSWKFAVLAAVICGFALQAGAQTVGPTKRLTQPINEKNLVTLTGHVHPKAQSRYDQGAAPDSLPMERMKLLLKRSPDQEKALRQLIEAQQAKGSPTFHQWLTPAQIGAQFGVSDDDVKTVSAWLESHGFQVSGVSPAKTTIEFSGTAGEVRGAFHTEIHKFVTNGQEHWANATDPQIPAALAAVVDGPMSLNNFKKKPLLKKVGIFSRDKATGKVTPEDTIANCTGIGSGTCYAVSPGDFAAIYKVPATVNSQPAGTSQTIAIVGDSEICTASSPIFSECTADDVKQFRTLFGLPTTNLPQVVVTGPDPLFNSDETEGDLDVEWSGAVAPNAQILFVIGSDTEASAGIDLAAEYIIDNNLAPVMSESFGACEASLGQGGLDFYTALWEQAAAQGITVVISAGDAGSAGCDNSNLPSPNLSVDGLNVNGIASTPFNIAAGGTDFNIHAANYPNQYWNTSGVISAKGYVPETTWNDTCAQTAASIPCSSLSASSSNFLVSVVGGGGGQSGVFAKPSWQSGTGVPNDGTRDLPDISLFSADGDISGSFYIVCEADAVMNTATGCDTASPLPFNDFVAIGGTSAAAPTFAGIMSLVNQKTGARQGNANYTLYPLQATAGVFNDVTVGNNSAPCEAATVVNCSSTANTLGFLQTLNNSNLPSGTAAFTAGTGYDLATGLGSVNVGNLLAAWPASGSFTPTATTLSLTPSTFTHGTPVTVKSTVTPGPAASTSTSPNPEAIALIGTCPIASPNCFGSSLSNTAGVDHFDPVAENVDAYPIVTAAGVGTANGTTSELVGGTYTVKAHYPGNGTLGASDSAPVSVTVNSEASTTSVEVGDYNFNTQAVSGVSTAPYGSAFIIRTDVVGASGLETGTGLITIKDDGAALAAGAYPLNSEGYMELQSPAVSFPGSLTPTVVIPALAVGTHSFTSTYPGDASYKASNGGTSLIVSKAPTADVISSAPTSVASGASFQVTAFVDTPSQTGGSLGNAPTGTVTFFNGATQIGSPVAVTAAQDAAGFSAATATITTSLTATGSISAMYNGDANYLASAKSSPVTISITAGNGDFSVAGASPVTIAAPGLTGTSTITVVAGSGFSGTVSLACSVSPNNLTDPPGCSFTTSSVAVANPAAGGMPVTGTSTLMLSTTSASRVVPGVGPSATPMLRRVPVIGLIAAFALALLFLAVPAKQRRGAAVLGAVLLAIALTAAGCGGGGGGGGGGTHNPGTTTGTYVVTVTATSGSTVHTTMVTFNLN